VPLDHNVAFVSVENWLVLAVPAQILRGRDDRVLVGAVPCTHSACKKVSVANPHAALFDSATVVLTDHAWFHAWQAGRELQSRCGRRKKERIRPFLQSLFQLCCAGCLRTPNGPRKQNSARRKQQWATLIYLQPSVEAYEMRAGGNSDFADPLL
jgi:hypothetical protein